MLKKPVLAVTLACSMLWSASAMAITAENQLVFEELMAGNATFVAGLALDNLATKSKPAERSKVALAQKPKVIVLDCSDSRLAPEILFDKGLGELFVVRVAGNVIAPHQIASIEYAIEHLGAKMVMVLGHERCGGVTAAYGAYDALGNPTPAYTALTPALQALVTTMQPAVLATKSGVNSITTSATATDCILNNTHITMNSLKTQSTVIAGLLALPSTDPLYDELALVEAFYDLEDGQVTVTKVTGNTAAPAIPIVTTSETAIHTVTSSAGPNGIITPSGDSAAVSGSSQKFKVGPASGYVVDLVTGTCPAGTWSSLADYTVPGITGNCTVAVSFKAVPVVPAKPILTGPVGAGATINPIYTFTGSTAATHYMTFLKDLTTFSFTFSSWIPVATACVGTSCSITQGTALIPGHNYMLTVVGKNAIGNSNWSAAINFTP
jgi:carbonic anhydrase